MTKRIIAIIFIFICASIAWAILGATIFSRTYSLDSVAQDRVASTWGAPQNQLPPTAVFRRIIPRTEESLENGKKIVKKINDEVTTPLPLESSTVDGMAVPTTNHENSAVGTIKIGAGKTAKLGVGYRSQGLNEWRYSFGAQNVTQVYDFALRMKTNFKDIDFPENTLSPSIKTETGPGWDLTWSYKILLSGYQIAMF